MSTAIVAANHARALQDLGRYAEAAPILQYALEVQETAWGRDDARLAITVFNLGLNHLAARRFDDVELSLRRTLDLAVDRDSADVIVVRSHTILGELFAVSGRYDEAETHLLAAHRALLPRGVRDAYLVNNIRLLTAFYTRWGREDEAAQYRAMLDVH